MAVLTRERLRPAPWVGTVTVPVLLALVGAAAPAGSQLTQEEALSLAFPGALEVERVTAYLDEDQMARAAALAGPGVEVESGVVTYYRARGEDGPLGVAYFDAHRVRTLPEVLMVVVGPDATVRRVETVSFREPPEYRAPGGWLALMEGEPLGDGVSLKGGMPNLTGATLTAQAATRAVRRVLALHAVIRPLGGTSGPPGTPEGGT